MAAQPLPLPSKISQQSSRTTKFRTKTYQFGYGYSQRAADGINSKIDTWVLTWDNLTQAESNVIVSILDMAGSHDILLWTPYGETIEKKFVIDKETGYSFNPFSGDLFSVSTTIIQVYDI